MCSFGLRTPQRGKVEFAVRTKSGAVIAKCWNRNTKVLIESK